MKKILGIFLVCLLSLSMVACSDPTSDYIEPDKIDHNEEVETDYFEARILEVYEKSIVVEPIDGSNASKSSDKIDVTIDGISVDFDLVVGNMVGITYAGGIAESYPAQINDTISMVFISAAENNEKVALIPMVMVKDLMYYDTGRTNNVARCGVMDGEISSSVESWERPIENNQSNFGSGFEYQVGMEEGTIEIYINDNWCVFEARGGDGSMIQYNGKWYDKSTLSESTLKWLELSETERMLSSYYPPEFVVSSDICDRDDTQEEWCVSLEAVNVTPKGLTIACHQMGGAFMELSTGSYYVIQRLEDAGFVDVEYLPQEHDVVWTSEALVIFKDATTTWDVDWEWLYGELPVGEYRIGKEIMNFRGPGDFETEMIYAHFEITE